MKVQPLSQTGMTIDKVFRASNLVIAAKLANVSAMRSEDDASEAYDEHVAESVLQQAHEILMSVVDDLNEHGVGNGGN